MVSNQPRILAGRFCEEVCELFSNPFYGGVVLQFPVIGVLYERTPVSLLFHRNGLRACCTQIDQGFAQAQHRKALKSFEGRTYLGD